jgi:hypothetical protein
MRLDGFEEAVRRSALFKASFTSRGVWVKIFFFYPSIVATLTQNH